MQYRKFKNGFTLVEILVVVGLVVVLSAIVLASLSGAKKQGRDGKRVSDIKQIQLALELYYDQNRQYPATLSGLVCGSSCVGKYLPGDIIPKDPQTSADYFYSVSSSGGTYTSFHLGANLELNSSALNEDDDAYTTGPCTSWPGGQWGCDSSACDNVSNTSNFCYDVKNQ